MAHDILQPDWILIGGEPNGALQRLVEGRTRAAEAARTYRVEDIAYLKKMNMHVAPGQLQVSDLTLEKLRKMCQLWYIDLKPGREISSHRKLIGPMIVAAKKALFPIIRFCLKDTLKQQRDFNAAVIAAITHLAENQQPSN